MNNERFWGYFWLALIGIIAVTVYSLVRLNLEDDAKVRDQITAMVKAGASPTAARCAVLGMNTTNSAQTTTCIIVSQADSQLGVLNGQSPTVHK